MATPLTKNYTKRRLYRAKFQRHNGNQDATGTPTYPVDGDWDTVAQGWPCELVTTGGGERIRGRQVSASTTHVLIGEYFAVYGKIGPDCRVLVEGRIYNVLSVVDPDGLRKEIRVEARQSW